MLHGCNERFLATCYQLLLEQIEEEEEEEGEEEDCFPLDLRPQKEAPSFAIVQ